MIAGVVTDDLEAIVRLRLFGPAGREREVDVVIDTGFDGFLTFRSHESPTWDSPGDAVAEHSWRMVPRPFSILTKQPWNGMAGRFESPWMLRIPPRYWEWRFSEASS